MTDFRLVELNPDNFWDAVALPPPRGEQAPVAPVVYSIAEAYVIPSAWPRVIMAGDEVVGFVMANFDPNDRDEAYKAAVWRLNVADAARNKGAGTFAVHAVADEARRRGFSRIGVTYETGDDSPEGFYLKLGFKPTGEFIDGEKVAMLDI